MLNHLSASAFSLAIGLVLFLGSCVLRNVAFTVTLWLRFIGLRLSGFCDGFNGVLRAIGLVLRFNGVLRFKGVLRCIAMTYNRTLPQRHNYKLAFTTTNVNN
jgi:uncharacterized membrane protein YgdD (TMEM256/DUF423 family)